MTFQWPPTILCQHIINSFIKSKTVFNPSWHIWYEIHRNEFYRCLITHSRVVFDIIKNSIYCVFCYALIIVFNTMLIEQIYYIDHSQHICVAWVPSTHSHLYAATQAKPYVIIIIIIIIICMYIYIFVCVNGGRYE